MSSPVNAPAYLVNPLANRPANRAWYIQTRANTREEWRSVAYCHSTANAEETLKRKRRYCSGFWQAVPAV